MAMNNLCDWFCQASSAGFRSRCSELRHCCEELLPGENNAQHVIFIRPLHKRLALSDLFQLSVDLERDGGNDVLQELHDVNVSISRQVLHDTIIDAAVQFLEQQFTMPLLRAWSSDSVFAAITVLWELLFASHTLTPRIRLTALGALCRAYDVCSERVFTDPAPEDPGCLVATPLMDNNRRQMLWDVLLAPAMADPEGPELKQLAGGLLHGCAQEGGERWLASATCAAGLQDLRIVLDTAGASRQHKLLAVSVMYRLSQQARPAYGPCSQHLMHSDEGKRVVSSLEKLLGQQQQEEQQGQQEQEEPGATQAAIRQAALLLGERHSDAHGGAMDQQGVWRYTVPDHELSVRCISLASAAVLVARFKTRSAEDGWVRIRPGMVRLFRICKQAQEQLVPLAAAASTQEQATMVLELLENLVAGAGGISTQGWQCLCSAATSLAQVAGATAAGQVPPQQAGEAQQAQALLAVVTPIWQELGPGLGPPGAAQQDTRPLAERALRCADRICAKLQSMAGMATTTQRGGLQQGQVLELLRAGTRVQLWPLVASSSGMLLAMRQAALRLRLRLRREHQPLAAAPGAAQQQQEGQVHDGELASAVCKALLLAGKLPDDYVIAPPAPADDADGAGGGAGDDGREAACAALEQLLVDLQGSDAQAVLAAVLHQQLIPQLLQQMPRLDSEVASVVPGLGLGLGLGARLALGGLCAVRGVAGRMLLQAGVLDRMEAVVQACRAAGQQAEQLQAELLWAALALHQVAAISAAGTSGYERLVRHVAHEPRLSKASLAAAWSLIQGDTIFRTSSQLASLLVNHLPAALQALMPLVRHELRSRQGQAALVEAQAAAGGLAYSPPAASSFWSGSRHLQATAAALSAVQLVAWAAEGGVPLQGTGAVAQVAASLADMCDAVALMLFPQAGAGVLLGNAAEQGAARALAALLGVMLRLRAALLRTLPSWWQVEEQQEEQAQAVTAGAVSLWRILYTGHAYSEALLGCPHLPVAAAEVMGIAQQLPLPATLTTVLHTPPLPAGNTMQAAGQLLDLAQELLQVHMPAVLAAAAAPGEQGHQQSAGAAICHAALCCLVGLAAAYDPARQGIMQREPVMAAAVALLAGPQQGQAATLAATALRLLAQLVQGCSAHEQVLVAGLPGLLPALASQLAPPADATGPAAAEAVSRQRQVLGLLQGLTAGNATATERVAAAAAQQLYLLFLPAQGDDELAVLALELLRVMAGSSDTAAELISQAGQAIVVVLQQLG